jgi:hypothetical protein
MAASASIECSGCLVRFGRPCARPLRGLRPARTCPGAGRT